MGARSAGPRLHRDARAAVLSRRGRAGMRHIARKRFGQHFLADETRRRGHRRRDRSAPRRTAGRDRPRPRGADRSAGGALRPADGDRARSRPGGAAAPARELDVVESDVLKVDFGALARTLGGRLRVVGNLPYNISTPILFHLLVHVEHVRGPALHAAEGSGRSHGRRARQQELRPPERDAAVALRDRGRCSTCRPKPSTRRRGWTRRWFACGHWCPPRMSMRCCSASWSTVAFSQRRKLLRNTLGRWLAERGHGGVFDLQRRAEEVPVDEYLALARSLAGTP